MQANRLHHTHMLFIQLIIIMLSMHIHDYISFFGLLVKWALANFISPDTKERSVNVALVKVPCHTDNILGMSRKL